MAMRIRGGCVCVDVDMDVDVDIGEYCHPLTTGGSTLGQFDVSRRISHLGADVVIPLIRVARENDLWWRGGKQQRGSGVPRFGAE